MLGVLAEVLVLARAVDGVARVRTHGRLGCDPRTGVADGALQRGPGLGGRERRRRVRDEKEVAPTRSVGGGRDPSGEFVGSGTSDAPRDIWTRTRWPACVRRPDARHPTSPCRSTCWRRTRCRTSARGSERAVCPRGRNRARPRATRTSSYPPPPPRAREAPRGAPRALTRPTFASRASSRSVALRTTLQDGSYTLTSGRVSSSGIPLNARRSASRKRARQQISIDAAIAGIANPGFRPMTVPRVYSFRRDVALVDSAQREVAGAAHGDHREGSESRAGASRRRRAISGTHRPPRGTS